MKNFLKNLTSSILIGFISFSSLAMPIKTIYGASPSILYEQKKVETITKGVTYELSHRLTNEGWVDVNVLKVNLEDANITVAPVQSTKELGLKEPLTDLLYNNGAIAGVNSDFFGMKGAYSASFGIAIQNGNIMSSSDDKNNETNDYATFFMDKDNIPFMEFLKINFEFLNGGNKNIDINAINKAGDQVYAMKFDKNGGETTQALDNRFTNLVKIVVENDIITYISQKGETVPVPENGYLIITNEQWYDERAELFVVGQTAEFKITSTIDINNINTAISGGAKILDNGVISASPGAVISPKSRQPRTAIGITADGKELIFIVVDGRSHSIGATQDELATLLLQYGAYNAMNFDGGGSSTMIAKTLDDQWLTIKNTLSEGSQRKVINGFGVFNNSTLGNISKLAIKVDQDKVFKNTSANIEVYGYDEYYNRIDIPYQDIIITADNEGIWNGQTSFTPTVVGDINITAQYGELTASTKIKSLEISEIKSDISYVRLEVGESVYMNLSGLGSEGFKAKINSSTVKFEVSPATNGKVENGVFTALNNGDAYIKCSIGEIVKYILVSVGSKKVPINSFETLAPENILFTSQPDTIQGSAEITNEQLIDGQKSLKLKYTFDISESTQAAYLDFITPIEIPDELTDGLIGLEMDVYGNNSNQWLRGRIVDGDGNTKIVDFAKEINWEGWKKVKVILPDYLKYPIKLDRLYVASLKNDNINENTIYMDNLQGLYNFPDAITTLPQSSIYSDKKKVDLSTVQLENSFDITILPSITAKDEVKPDNYAEIQSGVFEAFKNNSALGIFAGAANIEGGTGIIKYSNSYNVSEFSNVGIVQMTAKNGGLRNTNQEQWKWFENDILGLNKDHIIIIIDKSPLMFTDTKEKELFQSIMEKIYDTGKNIFIISSEGDTSWSTINNGIRYFNLGSLFNADGSVNKNFEMLRLRLNDKTILYDYK